MVNNTLRKYLFNKRLELYEEVNELKDIIISNTFTEKDVRDLEIAEAKLNVITEVYDICKNRNKF